MCRTSEIVGVPDIDVVEVSPAERQEITIGWDAMGNVWSQNLAREFLSFSVDTFDPREYMRAERIPPINGWQRLGADYVLLRMKLLAPELKKATLLPNDDGTENAHWGKIRNKAGFIKRAKDVYLPLKPDFRSPLFQDGNFFREYVHTVRQYGNNLHDTLTRYGRVKALANAVGLILMSDIASVDDPRVQAICALSYLHPVADTLVDSFGDSLDEDKLRRLAGRLVGDDIEPQQSDELVLFGLLGDIEAVYPRDSFPQLYYSMKRLHEAQLRSLLQQGSHLTADQLLYTSFQKGGWATVLYGALASGELTEEQFKWLFQRGSYQQLIDDFLDVREDRREGNTTIFTHTLSVEGTIDSAIARYHLLEQSLHDLGDYPVEDPNVRNNMTLAFTDQRVAKIVGLYMNYPFLSRRFRKAFRNFRPVHNWLFSQTIGNFIYQDQ